MCETVHHTVTHMRAREWNIKLSIYFSRVEQYSKTTQAAVRMAALSLTVVVSLAVRQPHAESVQ